MSSARISIENIEKLIRGRKDLQGLLLSKRHSENDSHCFVSIRAINRNGAVISLGHAQRKERRQLRGLFHSYCSLVSALSSFLSPFSSHSVLFRSCLLPLAPFLVRSPALFHPLLPWPNRVSLTKPVRTNLSRCHLDPFSPQVLLMNFKLFGDRVNGRRYRHYMV